MYILILPLIAYILYKQRLGNRVYIKSTFDNKPYLVTSSKRANIIAQLNLRKNKLCNFLQKNKNYNSNIGIKRLLKKKHVIIEERADYYAKEAAYSINKGERIGICLSHGDMNTTFFVLMHELAHIMTSDYKHNKEFWDNFALLIKAAIECKLYIYRNYSTSPTNFCGHDVTHTPFKK